MSSQTLYAEDWRRILLVARAEYPRPWFRVSPFRSHIRADPQVVIYDMKREGEHPQVISVEKIMRRAQEKE